MNPIEFDIEHIGQAARQFIDAMGTGKIFAFHGEMGAGKTTFINEVCRLLGVNDDATASPTFALVNEYRGTEGSIYHMDLYRVESAEEARDMGIEDYLDSGNLCFIEWPDVATPFLPDDTVNVHIIVKPGGKRSLALG